MFSAIHVAAALFVELGLFVATDFHAVVEPLSLVQDSADSEFVIGYQERKGRRRCKFFFLPRCLLGCSQNWLHTPSC
ncbi:hypothetical protein VII00023_06432 [Vibrio ichthyoenteri ATCC 700023]|uniref:Uncharacterized protein n=1 Tax=Vibrio ichthyoenteri ATCC 700023 TaxID=870968 RepID=F9S6J8_9VIBR|nr:hypothetical protein VII00023_06432 [Vibrio ichthyoenteri ATCC 700023]